MNDRRLELRPPAETPRHVPQRGLDALDLPVRDEPAFVAHPGVDLAQLSGKFVRMRIDLRERPLQEPLERLSCDLVETAGEEVIDEHVADHARVVAVIGDQDASERGRAGMIVGEPVDPPVLEDPRGHGWMEPSVDTAFDEVAGEIADQRLGIVTREEEMGEMIHTLLP